MLNALLHELQCRCLASETVDLGPAGDAWLHMVAKGVTRDQLLIIMIMSSRMRAWSNNRHLAPQHIEKLWQLVDAGPSQPRTDVRHSRIALNRLLDRRAIIKNGHGAELEDSEFPAVEAVPRLHEERRTGRVQLDRKGDNEKHRGQKHDAHDRHCQI